MNDLITDSSTNVWFIGVIFLVAFFDSVIPLVPSDFAVIAGGVASGAGTLIDGQVGISLLLVIGAGALGAFAGDSMAYWIGQRSEQLVKRLLFRGEAGEQRLVRAGKEINRRGGLLLVSVRFIPGGRTAMTISCGLTAQPYLGWFLRWNGIAVVVWASYVGILGAVFGNTLDNPSAALWIAFGVATSITIGSEVIRAIRERRLRA